VSGGIARNAGAADATLYNEQTSHSALFHVVRLLSIKENLSNR
jgi:hypothetical protein